MAGRAAFATVFLVALVLPVFSWVAAGFYWDPGSDLAYLFQDYLSSAPSGILRKMYSYSEAASLFSSAAGCLPGNASSSASRVAQLLSEGAAEGQIIDGLARYLLAISSPSTAPGSGEGCDPVVLYKTILISIAYTPANGSLTPSPSGIGPAGLTLGQAGLAEELRQALASEDPDNVYLAGELYLALTAGLSSGQERSAGLALAMTLHMGPYSGEDTVRLLEQAPTRGLRLLAASIARATGGDTSVCNLISRELGANTSIQAPSSPSAYLAMARLVYTCSSPSPAAEAYRRIIYYVLDSAGLSPPTPKSTPHGGLDLAVLRLVDLTGYAKPDVSGGIQGSLSVEPEDPALALPGIAGNAYAELARSAAAAAASSIDSGGLSPASREAYRILSLASQPGAWQSPETAAQALAAVEVLARGSNPASTEAGALLAVAATCLPIAPISPLSPYTLSSLLRAVGEPPSQELLGMLRAGDLEDAVRLGAGSSSIADNLVALAASRLVGQAGGFDQASAREELARLTGAQPPPAGSELDAYLEYLNRTLPSLDYYNYSRAVKLAVSLYASEPGGLVNLPLAASALSMIKPLLPPMPAPPSPPESGYTTSHTAITNTGQQQTSLPQVYIPPEQAQEIAQRLLQNASSDPVAYRVATLLRQYALTGNTSLLEEALETAAQDPQLGQWMSNQIEGGQAQGNATSTENRVIQLVEQGDLDEAKKLLDSLPKDERNRLLDELRQARPDILSKLLGKSGRETSGLHMPNIKPPSMRGPGIGRPSFSGPSLSLPSMSLPSMGGGGLALLLLPLLLVAVVALYMGRNTITGAISGMLAASRARAGMRRALEGHGEGGPVDPRAAVIEMYRSLLAALARLYRPKWGWETHWEYGSSLPEEPRTVYVPPARIYELAKFSGHAITREHAEEMGRAVERLLESFRGRRK